MSESESDALPLGDTPIYANILYNYKNMLSMKNEWIYEFLSIIFVGGNF